MTEEQLPYSGCPFPLDLTCIDQAEWDDLSEPVRTLAVALASSSLHALSGGRVGGCPVTVRPCPQGSTCYPLYAGWDWMTPGLNAAGAWVNNCGCGPGCAHPACSVLLDAPVGQVYAIKVDGVELDLSDFRVDGNLLVYTGTGDCPFPATQDVALPDTEPGTWSITYLNAIEPDLLAAQAAAQLAWEFAMACSEDRRCRLPSNVTAVTRTGVTMELNRGLWPDGFTGIQEVDAWIAKVNPRGRRRQSQVYSPDIHSPHVQGWVPTGGS